MTPSTGLAELVAEWRDARMLYPLYAAMGREFVIEMPSCADLEAGIDTPPQESIEMARQWLLDVDSRVQVHQLRQFLQTTTIGSDEALRVLLIHHLTKQKHSDSDRDKIDFLLVQYFSHCAPSRLEDTDVDLEYVAQTLEPVLGSVDLSIPDWLAPLNPLVAEAFTCKDLKSLLTSRILDKGRKIKTGAGENYYLPVAMVAFTRFSFMMRRVFFRLMHQDLNAILDGLRTLEQQGINTLDCRRAQFSAEEPISRLRMICQSWKVMFHAEYSSGQPLTMLGDLRGVVEAALARTRKSAPTRSHAAAAGAAMTDAPEFEVSSNVPGIPDDPSR
jgi:hypothetical protein